MDDKNAIAPSVSNELFGGVTDYYEPPDYLTYDEDNDDETNLPDCETCGGEFWNGGTSCTCADDDEDSIENERIKCGYCGNVCDLQDEFCERCGVEP